MLLRFTALVKWGMSLQDDLERAQNQYAGMNQASMAWMTSAAQQARCPDCDTPLDAVSPHVAECPYFRIYQQGMQNSYIPMMSIWPTASDYKVAVLYWAKPVFWKLYRVEFGPNVKHETPDGYRHIWRDFYWLTK